MSTVVEHQPRERAVTCQICRRNETWNVDAICTECSAATTFERAKAKPKRECRKCHGDGVIEVYAHPLSAEQTKTIRCPRCSTGKPVVTSW